MNKLHEHKLLMECLNRIPEHYTLYLLPDDRRNGSEYSRHSMTMESGEVLIFEFDFSVPCRMDIPWEDLENSLQHHCKTCEWVFCRGKGTSYCTAKEEVSSGECAYWDISPDAISLAMAEYYKKLYEKHYGKDHVITSHN